MRNSGRSRVAGEIDRIVDELYAYARHAGTIAACLASSNPGASGRQYNQPPAR